MRFGEKSGKTRSCGAEKILSADGDFFALSAGAVRQASHRAEGGEGHR